MSRIALDGITLAVGEWPGPREADTDRTVVCVHGLSANHACWASVAGVLSPDYRVIAYDLRGRGGRDKPDTGYSLEAHGEAMIALTFAVKRHDRVSSLVLFDGANDVRPEVWDSSFPPSRWRPPSRPAGS